MLVRRRRGAPRLRWLLAGLGCGLLLLGLLPPGPQPPARAGPAPAGSPGAAPGYRLDFGGAHEWALEAEDAAGEDGPAGGLPPWVALREEQLLAAAAPPRRAPSRAWRAAGYRLLGRRGRRRAGPPTGAWGAPEDRRSPPGLHPRGLGAPRGGRHPLCERQPPGDLPTARFSLCARDEARAALPGTLRSVLATAPGALLKELIVVDDQGWRGRLGSALGAHVAGLRGIKLLQSTRRLDAVGGRLLGAARATGDGLVFVDAPCKCHPGWLEPLLGRIAGDRYLAGSAACGGASPGRAVERGRAFGFSDIWRGRKSTGVPRLTARTSISGLVSFPPASHLGSVCQPGCQAPPLGGGHGLPGPRFEGPWEGPRRPAGGRALSCSPCSSSCSRPGPLCPCPLPAGPPLCRSPGEGCLGLFLVPLWCPSLPVPPQAARPDCADRLRLRRLLGCRPFHWFLANMYPELHPAERGPMSSGKLHSPGLGLCAACPAEDSALGGPVTLAPCRDGRQLQLLQHASRKEIHCGGPQRLCFNVRREQVVLQSCTWAGPALHQQHWDLQEDGMIVHFLSGKCMEAVVQGNNKDIYLRQCDGKPSQLWRFDQVNAVDER
ncbi:polypeptide N-acetylgalactosaminyltransferase 15 [Dasypus novemcinctus]|uniref:polypeptide N-acetylgalactosaminyltransferase 15 n=1 Tax=Dasypus novemcinctus TaxID=9361 RepID=UPI0039C9C161